MVIGTSMVWLQTVLYRLVGFYMVGFGTALECVARKHLTNGWFVSIEKAGGQTKIFGLHQCIFALYIIQHNII